MKVVSALVLATGLLLSACGVPSTPSVGDLQGRAAGGDAGAARELVGLLGREAPAEIRAEAYRALLEVGASHADRLREACRDPDPVRREHALALAANLRLEGAFAEAVRALEDAAFPRRYVAAWALGELGDTAAVGPLVRALTRESGEVAKAVARALVRLGPEAVGPVLPVVPSLGSEGRGYAVRALGELRDPRALPVLLALLADPADPSGRADAAWALGQLGDPRGGEALVPVLGDPDWRARLEASRAVGLLEAREAEGSLEQLRRADPHPAVREWAARTLAIWRGMPQTYPDARGEWVLPDELYR
ncbi:MAG: HEAT repeat domain-containing protein [Thermodesulfobacteriota bacterium]